MTPALLEARGLVKSYPAGQGRVQALRGVDLSLARGELLGLVGESGSGKSTLARLVLRLEDPDRGQVILDGTDLTLLRGRQLRPHRRRMQIIFQDPQSSLDPRQTILDVVTEPLLIHRLARGRRERRDAALELLTAVGLTAEALDRYPHEFSGGQRQRIAIARALALHPELIVADEPVSSLDVSVQAQIANLLQRLHRREGTSILLISHGIQLVLRLCDRVAVMYLGRLVEEGPAARLAVAPLHPYTRALLRAARPSGAGETKPLLTGEPPSPLTPPPGCAFHPRCPLYAERRSPACTAVIPDLMAAAQDHRAACHEVPCSTPTMGDG